MASILYYSNLCAHSKKLLQQLSKTHVGNDLHFICIDKRITENGKMYIILENSQKIVMPNNIQKVPALLLLSQQGKVLYGDDIYKYIQPIAQQEVKQATQNNMEPTAFMFGGGSSVASDTFSFLDMDATSMSAEGDGGLRQMHNYMSMNDAPDTMAGLVIPQDDGGGGLKKNTIGEGDFEKLKNLRMQDDNVYKKTPQNSM
jgi:glutaredoxin-related protein